MIKRLSYNLDNLYYISVFTIAEAEFDRLSPTQVPEMQRSDLSPLVLQMKALGIANIVRFDYIAVSWHYLLGDLSWLC